MDTSCLSLCQGGPAIQICGPRQKWNQVDERGVLDGLTTEAKKLSSGKKSHDATRHHVRVAREKGLAVIGPFRENPRMSSG
jgi:hypothetical protein